MGPAFSYKEQAIKAAKSYRKRNYIFSEQWRVRASAEIQKAQGRVFGYPPATAAVTDSSSNTDRCSPLHHARRCSQVISTALETVGDDLEDMQLSHKVREQRSAASKTTAAATATADDLGYVESQGQETTSLCTTEPASLCTSKPPYGQPLTGRRRYHRRCSVTEFSLKAAVIAKMQLERENGAC